MQLSPPTATVTLAPAALASEPPPISASSRDAAARPLRRQNGATEYATRGALIGMTSSRIFFVPPTIQAMRRDVEPDRASDGRAEIFLVSAATTRPPTSRAVSTAGAHTRPASIMPRDLTPLPSERV